MRFVSIAIAGLFVLSTASFAQNQNSGGNGNTANLSGHHTGKGGTSPGNGINKIVKEQDKTKGADKSGSKQ